MSMVLRLKASYKYLSENEVQQASCNHRIIHSVQHFPYHLQYEAK